MDRLCIFDLEFLRGQRVVGSAVRVHLQGQLVVAAADLSLRGRPGDPEQVVEVGGLEQLFTFLKQTHSSAPANRRPRQLK